MSEINLKVKLGNLELAVPIVNCSGTIGLKGLQRFGPRLPSILGAAMTKSIGLEYRPGNPSQRIAEVVSGLLNAIGLAGPGIKLFKSTQLPEWLALEVPVGVSICGNTVDDFVQLVEELADTAIAFIELNLSCPNIKAEGLVFSINSNLTHQVVSAARGRTNLPLAVKLTPNVTNIADPARAAEGAGADILTLVNTFIGLAIDIRTRRPKLGNITGGLSGPAIRPLAVQKVWQVYQAVKIPIIGMGGVSNADDTIEMMLAGATVVGVGTANFTNPDVLAQLPEGIIQYLEEWGCHSVAEIVGQMKTC